MEQDAGVGKHVILGGRARRSVRGTGSGYPDGVVENEEFLACSDARPSGSHLWLLTVEGVTIVCVDSMLYTCGWLLLCMDGMGWVAKRHSSSRRKRGPSPAKKKLVGLLADVDRGILGPLHFCLCCK